MCTVSEFSVISSGLSQWVVCNGLPYSVEIYRLVDDDLWTLQIIDAHKRNTLWENQLADDAFAFIEAVTVINSYQTKGLIAGLHLNFPVN